MRINSGKNYCYRICHIDNLEHISKVGLCSKHHPNASDGFRAIGNPEIINIRDETPVRLKGYGLIGEYVPFYFTPRSIMLYNIITGHRAPMVPQLDREEIIVICARIAVLCKVDRFFFTEGQANVAHTKHFHDLKDLDKIDWPSIQAGNFGKSDGDLDRPRRYQAEFLVYRAVPFSAIDSIVVYNENVRKFVEKTIRANHVKVPVITDSEYFF